MSLKNVTVLIKSIINNKGLHSCLNNAIIEYKSN